MFGHNLPRNCNRTTSIKRTLSNSATKLSRLPLPEIKDNADLFNYTRGRFVCNEKFEMSQRRVRFNVQELARCAAEAVGAKYCQSIEKYPEGMYNKTMLLTMDNGSQVVAKVPNPNAGVAHFTTASEVATMDFARNILGTAVPKVLAWSSRAQENPVSAEFIIMEKVEGVELERLWPTMGIGARFEVVKSIAKLQKAWSSFSFNGYGSLYYAKDLDRGQYSETIRVRGIQLGVEDNLFAIGPSTGREFLDNGRASVDFDRGPWNTIEEHHAANGKREIASISNMPRLPKPPLTLCGPGTYQPRHEMKLKALDYYLEIFKYLIPTDPSICLAHLWHGDLHVANIFVNPHKPTGIVGLIDWQSTEIAPLYFQARQPQIIDYSGSPVRGLERPELPEDFKDFSLDVKRQRKALYLHQSLCSLYNTLISHRNPPLYAALEFQNTPSFLLLLLARNLLIDGEASYIAAIAALRTEWATLPRTQGIEYPFDFSSEELAKIEANVLDATRGMDAMQSIKECIGDLFPEQGIVRPDQYDEALDALEQLKDQIIAEFATNEEEVKIWERMWPFGT